MATAWGRLALFAAWAAFGYIALLGFGSMAEGGGAWLDVAGLFAWFGVLAFFAAAVWAWFRMFGLVRDAVRTLVEPGRRPPSA
ncbi:MAG: hypothetical protein HYT80_01510 [Euryarchaeota archaeon]|nr:hypothetical protein [Euryarchaeota archaeon]